MGKILLILVLLSLFLGARSALAVIVTISNIPDAISDQPFSINVSVSGASAATNYLRANFFPAGTTNYFGFTYNGADYINSSTYSQYLPITIDSSGNWSGTIQAKIDTSSSYYTGSGTYSFKVRRYTESGSSYTWSNELSTIINLPTPTPSPTSTPTTSSIPTSSSSNQSSSFTISDTPSQINSDQSFNAKVSLSMPSNANTDYYLKGAFKKSDGTRYLGLTKKNSEWVEYGDDYSDQYKITTDSLGNWNGSIEVKPDTLDNDYKGSGDYIFKVGRYTNAGSGPTWSNETTIKINDLNSPSPSNPSTSQSTLKTTASDSASLTVFKSPIPKPSYQIASIAGVNSSTTPQPEVEVKSQKQTNPFVWVGLSFIFAGAGLIGYIYFKKYGKIRLQLRR